MQIGFLIQIFDLQYNKENLSLPIDINFHCDLLIKLQLYSVLFLHFIFEIFYFHNDQLLDKKKKEI